MTTDARLESGGFVPFYRSYTKTWIHAVATAGLTAFGTLTIVHRWFAALALASYVVPPVVLYLRHGRGGADVDSERPETEAASEPDAEAEPSLQSDARADSASVEPVDSRSEREGLEPTASSDGPDEATAAERSTREAPEGPVPAESETARDSKTETETESESETEAEPEPLEWHAVDAPTDATLRDVAIADTGGANAVSDSSASAATAYAVGDGGVVLAGGADADADGDEWTTVLEDGPAAGGNDLRGADATADGAAVWVAGDSGALGRIDAETGRHTDYTAPEDVTDNWLGVAVGGASGGETVILINGSGAVLRGEYRAAGDDGDATATLEWTGPDKPGSGSSFSGVALADGVGYCCDTNDGVYETTDGGDSFERVGLEGADGTLTGVATAGQGDCLVSADDGVVHRYDGPTWTPERVADASLTGVARREDRAAASATDGTVRERVGPAADWDRFEPGVSAPLLAISLGSGVAVAVGEGGAIAARG